MKINLKLNKKDNYILTCSFGPDSMALCKALIDGGYDFIICHVNYHLCQEDEERYLGMKTYSEQHNIKVIYKDIYIPKTENEEGYAREKRYEFFIETAKKYNIRNILVAHNQDDLLETYLIQKKRKSIVSYYGLNESFIEQDINITRPLLKYKKSDLELFCKETNTPFGIDSSNFNTKFLRNKIRKEVVKDMDFEKRSILLNEIEEKNKLLKEKFSKLLPLIKDGGMYKEDIEKLDNDSFQLLLIKYFEILNFYVPISLSFVKELKQIVSNKTTWHKTLKPNVIFSFDYGFLKLYFVKMPIFNFKVNHFEKNEYFTLNNESKLFNLIEKYDTLFIRSSFNSNEVFILHGLKKKINRCFIDWKVPYPIRIVWPGIFDINGNLLYVPHYKKNNIINVNSLLIFNLNDFIK
ncbi:MAG: tRNA lysidine(34) synthetase TilS [Bacilli bacterium]